MTKTGRPSFSIRPDRLKALREQAGLTQKALAWPVFGVETPAGKSDPRTAANSYQRVESTGKTSQQAARKMAEVLAQKLGQDPERTLALLCGGAPEAPPNRVDEIEGQLLKQLSDGGNAVLQEALAHHKESAHPVRALAVHISARLEVAQLEQRSEQLAQLAELTGWKPADLQRPVSIQGYWLLNTYTGGRRETQIFLGVGELLLEIQKQGAEWLGMANESDTRVELSEDALWFRVGLSRARLRLRKEFSFVRCTPSVSGLQWVKRSEWDRLMLDGDQWSTYALKPWAFQNANFVKGIKAEEQWPRDLGRLRMWVRQEVIPENEETAEGADWWKEIAVHKGYLGEEPEYQAEDRARFHAEGNEHYLITHWLASGLWDEVLAPLLSPFPADWWLIDVWVSSIRVRTTSLPLYEKSLYALEPRGRTYFILLMEETDSGELRSAPWRQKDVQALAERLQKDLKACQEQVAIGPQRPRWITAA